MDGHASTHLLEIVFRQQHTYQEVQSTVSQFYQSNADGYTLSARIDALRHLAMYPLLPSIRKSLSQSVEDALLLYAASIAACGHLSNRAADDMNLSQSALTAYLTDLKTMHQHVSSHVQRITASLISEILQISARLSYHLAGIKQATAYAEEAVKYARDGNSKTVLVMALRERSQAYEWATDNQRKQTLYASEEAQQIIERKNGVAIAPLVQSWVYAGLAKYQALHGMTDETPITLEKAFEAFEAFKSAPSHIRYAYAFLLEGRNSYARLMRNKAISYAYLGQQDQALQTFAQIIDLNEERHFVATSPMSAQTHLGVLSETTFASLKLPSARKDKGLSIALWETLLQQATKLHSETYFQEVGIAYHIIEALWSDSREIINLREQIVHW